jgi:hypothetical protein
MKTLISIIFITTFASCNSNRADKNASVNANKVDTFIKHDTIYISQSNNSDWQKSFNLSHDPDKDTIWGKPVSYYLNDKECATIAYEFYYGYFRPSDDGATDELLKYAVTDNNKLRPFYRWCLNKTIQISDGALAEHVGVPARRYAEQFPKEFFEYMDCDTTNGKYKDWVSAISYSGFYDIDDYKKPQEIRNRLINEMKKNCINCSGQLSKRIDRFAKDCFP